MARPLRSRLVDAVLAWGQDRFGSSESDVRESAENEVLEQAAELSTLIAALRQVNPPIAATQETDTRVGTPSLSALFGLLSGMSHADGNFLTDFLNFVDPSRERNLRYTEYDQMEESLPEIGTALDMYADYAVAGSMVDGDPQFKIISKDGKFQSQIDEMIARVKVDDWLWSTCRSMGKYGDQYRENVFDISGLLALENRPIRAMRVRVNKHGDKIGYIQKRQGKKDILYEPWQVSHFALKADPALLYGQSLLFGVRRIAKVLELTFDGLTIARLTTSQSRFKWLVDIGDMTPIKGLNYIREFRRVNRRRTVVDPSTGRMSIANNPLRTEEDLYIPRSRDGKGHDVVRLPGDMSMTRIADIEMQYERLMIGLKMNRGWFTKGVAFDSSTMTALMNFARSVRRVRKSVSDPLVQDARLDLRARGISAEVVESLELKAQFPQMTHADDLMRLKVDELRMKYAAGLRQGKFMGRRDVMTRILNFTDEEVDKLLSAADADKAPAPGGAPSPGSAKDTKEDWNLSGSDLDRITESVLDRLDKDSELSALVHEIRDLADLARGT